MGVEVQVIGVGKDEDCGGEGCFLDGGDGLDGPGEEGEGGEEVIVGEVIWDVEGEEGVGAMEGAGEAELFPELGGFGRERFGGPR